MTNPDPGVPKPEAPKPAAEAKPAAPPPAPSVPAVAKPAAPPAGGGIGLTRAPKDGPTGVITLDARTVATLFSAMAILVLLFAGTTVFLLLRKPHAVDAVVLQVPGMQGPGFGKAAGGAGPAAPSVAEVAPAKPVEESEIVKIGETFETLGGAASAIPGSWLNFRGQNYTNIAFDGAKLADRWPAEGPKVLWSLTLGEGHAGAAIHKGRVYVLDYDEARKADALRVFSLEDGKEIWRRSYKVKIRRNHGISRTVPAVTDKYVVTVGPMCHVMCVDAERGDLKWGLDLVKDFGSAVPNWYTAQCPIIDGTTAVIAPGGKDALVMAVDCETGKVLWKTPNPKGWTMSHSSVSPMSVNGRKTYLYSAPEGTVGVDAATGELLWSTQDWAAKVMSPAPVVMEDGHVFLTSGYGAGSSLIRVTESGGKFEAKLVWKLEVTEGLACEQQTPIYWKKHIFAVLPKDGGANKQQFVCMNPLEKGKIVWGSGKTKRFGLGPFVLADDKFYILNDEGTLTMCRASLEKYEELGEVHLMKGADAWAPIAVVGTRMILRDKDKMLCLDMGKGAP